jgi:hypothetical protein
VINELTDPQSLNGYETRIKAQTIEEVLEENIKNECSLIY